MKIAILILAAGSSTRMGEPKQLLPFGTTTLLGTVIENALQTNADAIFCVLGANYPAIKQSIEHYKVEIIQNLHFKDGLSASIVTGIKKLKSFDAVLICLGDQPKVDNNYLNKLITLHKENPTKIIASQYDEKLGVPAIFPKQFYPRLLQLQSDKGAKMFLNSIKEQCILLDSKNLVDIDTEEDYVRLIKGHNNTR